MSEDGSEDGVKSGSAKTRCSGGKSVKMSLGLTTMTRPVTMAADWQQHATKDVVHVRGRSKVLYSELHACVTEGFRLSRLPMRLRT